MCIYSNYLVGGDWIVHADDGDLNFKYKTLIPQHYYKIFFLST